MKSFFTLLVGTLLLLGLTGPLFAADKVHLRVMFRWAGIDPEAPYLDLVIKEFQKLHPEVEIQNDSISDERRSITKSKSI